MGTQIPTTNDRSRTYWTPTMERFFIDLMLEQMHRGSRVGHTFNKQAWTHMLTVFNAKFGSQYDKDVLKGRYTNLWKQFHDVKNILAQSGFSWDQTRQVIVADDDAWNAYLKVHPDARPYKSKTVLNFNDLCVIYGYNTADGRYSRSSHDLDFDDDVQGLNMGDEMGSITQLSSDRPRTEWNAAMDQHFIELMLDQVRRGNMIDNTFNKQAWTDMLALFNAKFGPQHSKRVLRHRYNKLSKYYSDLKVIINQDGFSWDETQKMAVADDNVWDAYIKKHPHARAYRMKTLSSFKDLGLIFGNATNNGVQSDLDHGKDLETDISRMKDGEAKGNQIVTVGDRTRTYWTPPMDRYLIDLLLDQVHRGNKVGQTFISQAWSDMVASFNFKFHSNHDKDVLKNRYKHMRRLYNDINNLLGNSGFSWNETREMIVADDHVWDAYTKAHPDGRSYRVKTVPSYQKLCIIFGEEICDGRYSRLAQGVGLYGEIPVLRSGESSIVLFESDWPENPSDLDWLPAMDRYFIDLMLEQVRKGGIVEKTISEQAWVHMVQSLSEKFGIKCDKHCLEKRYTILMKECDDISTLLSYHGFEWDATQQIVRADDAVWDAFIEELLQVEITHRYSSLGPVSKILQEHPDAIAYRNKVLGSYSSLCQIKRNGNNNIVLEVEADRLPRDVNLSVEDGIVSDQHRKRPTMAPSGTKCHSKLQKIGLEMQRSVPGIAEAVTTFVNGNGVVLESTIGALQALPDIDDDLLLDACDLLEDEKKAKTFLALDASLRKKWLIRKLRPQQCS